MGTLRRALVGALATALSASLLLTDVHRAEACGCLSPPAVPVGEFAVNQSAEQIIFEVEPGWVTAHVMISYAGAPESFAWLIPVPEAPELGISSPTAFAVIDRATAPNVFVSRTDACPVSEWQCAYHDALYCPDNDFFGDDRGGGDSSGGAQDAGASPDNEQPPVTVIDQQIVGDYQTVTFRADQAGAATQWLRDNGFVVNPTTSIYMEPYINAGMVFVAAKLVAGAGISAIKPLRLKYRADYPMVPLVLTAVAAQPHLTVTSYIYGTSAFRPQGHPLTQVNSTNISVNAAGRTNYPMVLARAVDAAGGDAFVREFAGSSQIPSPNTQSGCCLNEYDTCGIGGNDQCECPTSDFDSVDCDPSIREGFELVEALAIKHPRLTRLTTRVSAEEMTFDPKFEPDVSASYEDRQTLSSSVLSLQACSQDVVDGASFRQILAAQECSTVYCGEHGRCVGTAEGPACSCDNGFVAQRFNDLDNLQSVTCVPETPPVDLRAGGDQLPDGCAGQSCAAGTCIDRNGVPVCDCPSGTAASVGNDNAKAPHCVAITLVGDTPGAQNYTAPLGTLDVCAPPPPSCGDDGWLVKRSVARKGVACEGVVTDPPVSATRPTPAPTCGDNGFLGCGCQAPNGNPVALFGGVAAVGLLVFRRRRKSARA